MSDIDLSNFVVCPMSARVDDPAPDTYYNTTRARGITVVVDLGAYELAAGYNSGSLLVTVQGVQAQTGATWQIAPVDAFADVPPSGGGGRAVIRVHPDIATNGTTKFQDYLPTAFQVVVGTNGSFASAAYAVTAGLEY